MSKRDEQLPDEARQRLDRAAVAILKGRGWRYVRPAAG